jgi:hypothetical protein
VRRCSVVWSAGRRPGALGGRLAGKEDGMTPLFAHHVEPQHYPVLTAFLAVGFWLGWHLVSKLLAWMKATP